MADYSYLGSGRIYLRDRGVLGAALLEVGNCSALSLGVTEDIKELKDFTQPGGGTYNEVRRISAVEASMTIHDIDAVNLARALYGAASTVAGSAVTGESIVVSPDALAVLARLPATTPALAVASTPGTAAATRANTTAYTLGTYLVPATSNGFYYRVTAAGTSGGTIPTFPTVVGNTVVDGTVTLTCAGRVAPVAGTDYEVRAGGVFAYAGRTIAGETWTVNYTATTIDVVQALVNSGGEYELVFDGLNEARSGKRTRVRAYRVKIGALQSLGLIGEEYAGLEVSGKLLKDTAIVGAGVSQYFRVDIEV